MPGEGIPSPGDEALLGLTIPRPLAEVVPQTACATQSSLCSSSPTNIFVTGVRAKKGAITALGISCQPLSTKSGSNAMPRRPFVPDGQQANAQASILPNGHSSTWDVLACLVDPPPRWPISHTSRQNSSCYCIASTGKRVGTPHGDWWRLTAVAF